MEAPLTLLVAPREPGVGRSLRGLARRLAARLGHDVACCRLDVPAAEPPGSVEVHIERQVSHVVVLPVALGSVGAADRMVDRAVVAVRGRWPDLRVHRGAALATDDIARMLGDRAREVMREGPPPRTAPEDSAVVLVGAGDANPVENAELARVARLVCEAHRFRDVAYAFLELTAPSVTEIIGRWARLGVRTIVVVPYEVFGGRPYHRLVGQAVAAGRAARVSVSVGRPLASHPALVLALARRHVEALGNATDGSAGPYVDPDLLRAFRGVHAHDAGPLSALEALTARMAAMLPPRYRNPGVTVSPAPMGAAALQLDGDGTVAWDRMWQGFCELALAGGPPHRGHLLEPAPREAVLAESAPYAVVVRELERGIRMVTGLSVVASGPPGWVGIVCQSEDMAIWMMRAIVVENVLARREGVILYVPAGPRFTLEGEIKSVVTVVAKTHHYWIQHLADTR